jgi:hypothetical protein
MKFTLSPANLFQKTILAVAFALLASGTTLRAVWNEFTPSAGFGPTEKVSDIAGAVDTVWNGYWCGSDANRLFVIYYNGSAWVGAPVANNCAHISNNIAVDSGYHWIFYTGTDDYIWLCYWNGAGWSTARVGSSPNKGRQLNVDSVFKALWYVDNTGYLWILYWSGSAWVEVKIDGTNQRQHFGRCSGVDSTWHISWNLTSDGKSMRGTYWNGSSWVNGAPFGTLPGTQTYYSMCVQESTHTPFNWQSDAGTSTKGGYFWWSGSAWTPATCLQDKNLPTPPLWIVSNPYPYSCYFGGYNPEATCNFAIYNHSARNWTSGRQDMTTMGGGNGLRPLCVGENGRAILCFPGSGATYGVRMLYSDQP